MTVKIRTKHGLLPLTKDARDFSHHRVFGTLGAAEIPLVDFDVSPSYVILDQSDLDFCSAFSSSENNTALQGILTDPSLIDFLNDANSAASLQLRANLAVAFGFTTTPQDYITLSQSGQNADINSNILAKLKSVVGQNYFDPLYQMAKIKQVRGEWQQYGANLRDAAQALQKYGSLLKAFSPFTHNTGFSTDQTRDFIANWNNWPTDLDKKASPFKAGSFFTVDGSNDTFDNIRSILWNNKQTGENSGVIFGLLWQLEWGGAQGGVISDDFNGNGDGHAMNIVGQRIINGVPYLKFQQSWGKEVGDNGFFYFPRNVVNQNFSLGYGAFTFKKMSVGDAEYLNDNGISVNDNWVISLGKSILTFIKGVLLLK